MVSNSAVKNSGKIKRYRKEKTDSFYGDEPDLSVESSPSLVASAYGWYGSLRTDKHAKTYALDYLRSKKRQDLVKRLESVPEYKFVHLGWILRILSRGGKVPKETKEYASNKIKELLKIKKDESEQYKIPVLTVQDRIKKIASDCIADLDAILDQKDYSFDVKKYFSDKKLSKQVCVRFVGKYVGQLHEIEEVLLKKDEQLIESYQLFSRKELMAHKNFLGEIVNNALEIAHKNSAATKKPRKKKVKSLEKQTEKIKYQSRSDALGVVSIHPTTIPNGEQLWIFNTKTRKLSVFYGLEGGLQIKGTTIINFDTKKSMTKKVRKPEKLIPSTVVCGKVELKHTMESIKAKTGKLTGRINSDTLLLRVVK